MAADKKATIVIKKINVVAGGAHGGAWKVAFADFMTAMMAFFLVMWLLAQSSEATRKNVADYFSSPSVIEYNYSNFGVEITLEKLFLDFVNEPLNTLQTFLNPMDRTPNVMAMGMKKIIMAYMADQLGDIAEELEIDSDQMTFEIPDYYLFERGKAVPAGQFVMVMDKLKGVLAGLEDSDLTVTSVVYDESVEGQDPALAKRVSEARADLLSHKIEASMESDTVELNTVATNQKEDHGHGAKRPGAAARPSGGVIKFEIKQKKVLSDGSKPRPLNDELFTGAKDNGKSVYDNFVNKVSERKLKPSDSRKK